LQPDTPYGFCIVPPERLKLRHQSGYGERLPECGAEAFADAYWPLTLPAAETSWCKS
jgi:hypothetical protein